MNLKKFKKVMDDQHRAVFKNDKGHEITITKKGLTKKHLADLAALPLHAFQGAEIAPQENLQEPTPSPQLEEQRQVASEPQVAPPQAITPELTPQQKYDQARAAYINDNAAKMGAEDAAWDQDMANGHIQPKTLHDLYASKGTLGKIGTLFGMLVSGAGSGLAHQPNALLEMMNKEIDRDLEAQKNSKEGARNFLKLHAENELMKAQGKKLGVETEGLILNNAKNKMLLHQVHNLQELNNTLPPDQRAQGQQVLDGLIKPGVYQKIQQGNMNTAQQMADHPESAFNKKMKTLQSMEMLGMPEAGKVRAEMQEQHVPGYGDSSMPVPKDIKDELIGKRAFDQAAKAYIDFANKYKNNWMNLDPKSREAIKNQGIALASNVQNMFRAKNNGGVWKAGEQGFIEGTVPNQPASWSAGFNAIPKLQQAIHDNENETRNLTKGYALPFESFGSIGHTAPKTEHKESREGQKFYQGKWYKKGPNGEPVEVK